MCTSFYLWIQVTLPSGKKVASREETLDEQLRLNTQTLLDHANAISSALDKADGAKWGQKEHWKPFLKEALDLALTIDKLGEGKLAQARITRNASARHEPAHTPQDAERLKIKIIRARIPKEPKKFLQLKSILEDMEEYQAVHIQDRHMGITRLTASPSIVRRAFFDAMSFADFDVLGNASFSSL